LSLSAEFQSDGEIYPGQPAC